jgi:hypothetical protein
VKPIAPIYGLILNHLDHPRRADTRQLWRMAKELGQDPLRLAARLQYLKRHGLARWSRVTRQWSLTQAGRDVLWSQE